MGQTRATEALTFTDLQGYPGTCCWLPSTNCRQVLR